MVYSMNISKILNPPLPSGYWGNVCVPVYVTLNTQKLTNQPLWKTAVLIRDGKRCVNDEYVRSYIDFQELHYMQGISAGARVSAFTDWRRLGHSEVDFGWGPPISVMPLSWRLLGSWEC
jgi:Transferase family